MRAIVVYDSAAGNTEKIAQAIASGIGAETKAVRIGTPEAGDREGVFLLVIGSPTQGGRPTESMQKYMANLAPLSKETVVATFDTRLKTKIVKLLGYAADRMAAELKEKGLKVEESSQGFIVLGRTGPLAEGELERARSWGKELSRKYLGKP